MSLHKPCFFTILATIIVFVAVGRLNVQIKGFDLAMPNSRPHDSALAPDGLLWHMGPPANRLGRSDWDKPFRAENEIRPTVFLPVQSKNAKDLGAGKLLVASRDLADPHFAKTVVLLIHYDAEGGAWFIFHADAGTVFDSDPDSLWPQMIQKSELKLAGSGPAHADRPRAAHSTTTSLVFPACAGQTGNQ